MVSVCLPSDVLLQHLPCYLGFSYLGRGLSLHGCSSKVQPLLLPLHEGYLLTTFLPDLQRGIAPPRPSCAPCSHCSLDVGLVLPAAAPDLGRGVAPLGCCPWPRVCGNSSWPPPFGHGVLPASAPGLGRGVAPLGRSRPRLVRHSVAAARAYPHEWW